MTCRSTQSQKKLFFRTTQLPKVLKFLIPRILMIPRVEPRSIRKNPSTIGQISCRCLKICTSFKNAMQTSTPPPSGDSAFPIDKRWKELTRTLINRPSTVRGLHHCDLCSDDTTLSYLTRSQKYTIGDLQKHLYHSHMSCQWNDDPCKWGMHTNSSKWLRSHPFHTH